ncbi:fibronectin type III domain-containing protein [Eubacterium limosum]|uniref:fibronectin type III domain-containing protein n=1 Tax=Eubacterium limosum TaxID=1736 RepID=UPI00106396E7|nr:fibronectin type III domain-containing protein [Eubacterium limosum]
MKTHRTLLLILLCLFFTVMPVCAQTPENTADSAETLTSAVSALNETGGTIHITKDIILGTDSSIGGFEPDSSITLDLGRNTLYIQNSWSFKNITITGQRTLIMLENNADLQLDHSTLAATAENSTAIKITGNSRLSAEASKIESTGSDTFGINAVSNADLTFNSTLVSTIGGSSTAIHTKGSIDAYFSEITAEGAGATAVDAGEVLLNTSAVSPEAENAVIADTTAAPKNTGYHYTELDTLDGLPDSMVFKITDKDTGDIRYTSSLPVCWDTDTADITKAGIYPLSYKLCPDTFTPAGAAALLENQTQRLVVIDPKKPFIYYDAPVTENTGSYSLLLRFHQPIQSFGTPTLWVEKDNSGSWQTWPSEKITAAASNQYNLTGLEAGHSYVFQLEAKNGSINGDSNAIRITLDEEGNPTVTQSDMDHGSSETKAVPTTAPKVSVEKESTASTVSNPGENVRTGTRESLKSESTLYLQEMGNALKTVSSYLNGTTPVSENVHTGITGAIKNNIKGGLPAVAALSLTLLCAVTMLLVRKETTDVKDE